ncbi:arginine--tRNA ligase [Actinomadura scrupuli]|uniref:arginine--tRNA ligase n=1 Tax=Actinomadura scrupuli TaxID=559629 RepID=UPI003D995053
MSLRFNADSPSPQSALAARVQAAVSAAFGASYADIDPRVRPSKHGADLQVNVAQALAGQLGRDPQDVANEIVANLDVTELCSDVRVSGPGFINLTLRDEWIAAQVMRILADERLAVPLAEDVLRILVEFCSVNWLKDFMVAHLGTTVGGDSIARILEYLGHDVVRDNHVGDWGTPFGAIIEHFLDLRYHLEENAADRDHHLGGDLTGFYRAAREKFDSTEGFKERSLARVVAMQAGDPETLRLWQILVEYSKRYFDTMIQRLGVKLTDDDIKGESFYNDLLAPTVQTLLDTGLAVISEDAVCVFPPGFIGREGEPQPLIVRKGDGGFLYATTDLATVRHRVDVGRFDWMIYVVGAAQSQHLEMVWEVARMAGWLPGEVEVKHAKIGNVLGDDGKILRTRAGGNTKLSELLDLAVARAAEEVDRASHDEEFDEAQKAAIAEVVGIGAVKFAVLSLALDSERTFDLERMVSFRGYTGPYLQYAVVRMLSILRNAGLAPESATGPIVIDQQEERKLALHLQDFGPVLELAGATAEPHRLANYLFELAKLYSAFYENCPVLKGSEETRASRLALCAVTLRTMVTGLGLLGVPTLERM